MTNPPPPSPALPSPPPSSTEDPTTTATESILSSQTTKYYLLILHCRTLYTLPQILAIMQHKFHHPYTISDIKLALWLLRDEQDEMYLRVREMGKVELMWLPKIEEVKEAEQIEKLLKEEGRWVE